MMVPNRKNLPKIIINNYMRRPAACHAFRYLILRCPLRPATVPAVPNRCPAHRQLRHFHLEFLPVSGLSRMYPCCHPKRSYLASSLFPFLKIRALIISPGPGHPHTDSNISRDAIRYFAGKVPVLGVCMGFECVIDVYGGDIAYVAFHFTFHSG